MKTTKINLLIAVVFLFLLACNNKENKTNTTQNEITKKNTIPEKSSNINSPCELISMDDVKRIFTVAEHPIEMKDVVYTYPTCVYKWEDGKVTWTQSIAGQEIKGNTPSEVLIVMVKNSNENMYNRSIKVYKKSQIIPNLGDIAVWDSRMSQLTFLSNNYMFHVHVKVSNEETENKNKAIEVSNFIIKNLK